MIEFKTMLEKQGLCLSEKTANKFETYCTFLKEYNEHTNLTAITENDEIYCKHFYDSILPANEFKPNSTVIDIGTGAGFPGIPLKLVRNDLNITLVDSLQKRTIFLKELCDLIKIDATILHARAEDACKELREKFDYCVSRAVARLNTLVEWCLPFVKVGGRFIAYKSLSSDEEIEEASCAIKLLGGEVEKIQKLSLPDNMGERTLIFIKKIKNTPKCYPRDKNLAKKLPISNKN